MKVLVLNGPNLNLLGKRDTVIYGTETLEELNAFIRVSNPDHQFDFFQSNVEGELINKLQESMSNNTDGIMANFGAYSHTSVALHDALEIIQLPKVEVHLSNIHAREEFREQSLTGRVMNGIITGFGRDSYILGVKALEQLFKTKA